MGMDEVRVIVVDDARDFAEVLAETLEMDGYQVKVALDGNEALRLAEEFEPICALVDIRMPHLDGHELSRRLRAKYGDEVVLIAMTGEGTPNDRVSEAFSLFDYYLSKPVDTKALHKVLPPINPRRVSADVPPLQN
ncbi:response regulator [Roseateles sp.]|uniref:response regulator n=1 Tax=Roseateles sp. TaxID=1971397 RepID=UPI003BAAB2B3